MGFHKSLIMRPAVSGVGWRPPGASCFAAKLLVSQRLPRNWCEQQQTVANQWSQKPTLRSTQSREENKQNTYDYKCATEKHGRRLSMKYWLLNRDPYNGLWNNPHITWWDNPLYTLHSQGLFHCSSQKWINFYPADKNDACTTFFSFLWRFWYLLMGLITRFANNSLTACTPES